MAMRLAINRAVCCADGLYPFELVWSDGPVGGGIVIDEALEPAGEDLGAAR
jgi:hypothetical protein